MKRWSIDVMFGNEMIAAAADDDDAKLTQVNDNGAECCANLTAISQ